MLSCRKIDENKTSSMSCCEHLLTGPTDLAGHEYSDVLMCR